MPLSVQEFLLQLPDNKRQPALELREIILSVDPEINEAIKWGQLTFCFKKSNIAFIYTYKQTDYINLGFMKATELPDPKNLFEGTGKGMRHIKIRTPADIPAAQVKKWVKEALLVEA